MWWWRIADLPRMLPVHHATSAVHATQPASEDGAWCMLLYLCQQLPHMQGVQAAHMRAGECGVVHAGVARPLHACSTQLPLLIGMASALAAIPTPLPAAQALKQLEELRARWRGFRSRVHV